MRAVYLPAAIGFLIGGTASVLQAGWTRTFIGAAVTAALLCALLLIRGLWLANRKHHQINHEELDPDPFAMDLRVQPGTNDPTDTGDNR